MRNKSRNRLPERGAGCVQPDSEQFNGHDNREYEQQNSRDDAEFQDPRRVQQIESDPAGTNDAQQRGRPNIAVELVEHVRDECGCRLRQRRRKERLPTPGPRGTHRLLDARIDLLQRISNQLAEQSHRTDCKGQRSRDRTEPADHHEDDRKHQFGDATHNDDDEPEHARGARSHIPGRQCPEWQSQHGTEQRGRERDLDRHPQSREQARGEIRRPEQADRFPETAERTEELASR